MKVRTRAALSPWTAALLAVTLALPALADEPPTVILVRGPTVNDVAAEAAARIRGELGAAGFRVVVVSSSSPDVRADLENGLPTAEGEARPIAAFALFVAPSEDGRASDAEIWVSDRRKQKTVIQRARLDEADHGRQSEVLAVRAVELLKANLAEFWLPDGPAHPPAPSPPPAPPPTPESPRAPEHPVEAPRPPFGSRFGLTAGGSVLVGFQAVAPMWAPSLALSYGSEGGFGVRASFEGLGPSTTLDGEAGTARIDQQMALVELTKTWWPRASVVPFFSVGAGVQHLRLAGTGFAPFQGSTEDDWSLVTAVGVGVGVPLASVLSLVAQGRGIYEWPPTVVRVAGQEVGRVGEPSLLVDAGLQAVLP